MLNPMSTVNQSVHTIGRRDLGRAALTSIPLLSTSLLLPSTSSAENSESNHQEYKAVKPHRIRRSFKRTTLVNVKPAKLPCRLAVSRIIKGCKQLDGNHIYRGNEVEDFERFFAAGISTLDTADVFGQSESAVGDYLRLLTPPFSRRDVQVMTQLTIRGSEARSLNKQMVELKVRTAMRRLGLTDRIDLLSVHWEDYEALGFNDAMKWLMDLKISGLISHLGLANTDTSHLIEILDKRVEIGAVRVAYSILDRRPELFLSQVCEDHGISILPHGCLMGGFLSDTFLDRPAGKVILDTPTRKIYGQQLKMQGGWGLMQDVLRVLSEIATKHRTSISAVAIKWVLMQRAVGAVAVGARNSNHLNDLKVAALDSWTLDEDDLLAIDAAHEGASRNAQHDCYLWERGGPW
jgi:aryl-alcohol dehydrogenase-like predicted oxidoreductase